ncbi:hypothetical protein CQ14_35965 [Bradyrhizobium lablabi]|uniref:Uncharacterized protein n=1 Tax=Bradyrhizobium lablabi TaxID=722472 RepID=A0A0R3MTN6_9BRAD|nr:hypothetical protein [Bradyrhizobium lablabi]KRR20995.1 hypothetical protein CQ14_35965 [Bradyrhizobium lablabi]
MKVLFPEVKIDDLSVLAGPLTRPNAYVANPKAVAAQTFKAKSVEAPFHDSGAWSKLGEFFTTQFAVTGIGRPEIVSPTTEGDWIVYPVALVSAKFAPGCAVWLEGRTIRHVRLYADRGQAETDNSRIRAIIETTMPN